MNNTTTITQPSPQRHPAIRAVFTLIPFAFYLIALQINIPSYRHAPSLSTASYEAHTLAAVGLFPWFLAAVILRILVPRSNQNQDPAISQKNLHRTTNFIGLVFAILHSAWIVFVWTDVFLKIFHVGIYDPAFPNPGISSPLLAVASLVGSAILLKIILDVSLSRSYFHNNGRVFAIVSLLPILYSFVTTPFDQWLDLMSIVCLIISLAQCGVLAAFIFINPEFYSRGAKT